MGRCFCYKGGRRRGVVAKKHALLRRINKAVLNPVIRTFAGKKYVPLALVHHVGRKSGKEFETPIIVARVKGGFVIALTYGADVDWYRNLTAAGGGAIGWHGKEHAVGAPEKIDSKQGMALFPAPLRMILRLNHTEEFVRVRIKKDEARA
jgi:deazaflavin-dependent oxidoreductase (nitroreductase family)